MSKTSKVMVGVTSTALMIGLSGCSDSQEIPPVPEDDSCTDWEWDEDDGVWECDDDRSSYFGHYFYGGRYYKNKSLLHKSKDFIAYKNSSSFKGGTSGSSAKKSSGFGSGSTSSGG